ncbi:MAG: hypothetical protein KAJ14_07525 [Candidatus Omnitrophica bacterium]|nr:hypothetical protein [Candidatus Omnitrophota bacterium]
MKIAYLILAHHQPVHLKRLIEALRYDGDCFFVHLALKTDISEFNNVTGDDVLYLDKRLKVYHAGFSQVRAMISLMRKALKKQDFDYFIFLSGADYPIKPINQIHEFLKKNCGMNFMKFFPYDSKIINNPHLSGYYNVDCVQSVPKIVSLIVRMIFKSARRVLPKRSFFKDMIPYRGSTSWCLYKDTIKYIIQYLDTKKGRRLLKFFKYAFSPDEMIFSTIILNSQFAKRFHCYEKCKESINEINYVENKAYLHFIDWDSERENPAILDESDFERLKKSDHYFARKFDKEKSCKLLKKIDECLL